jgi:ABC-type amino acid transport substrate-binding protein
MVQEKKMKKCSEHTVRAFFSMLTGLLAIAAFHVHAQTAPTPAKVSVPNAIERIRASGTVNLGHRESSLPFSYLDADKQPAGYSVELCLAIVEAIKKELKLPNLKVKWTMIQAGDRIPFVRDGKVDLECGNTTSTAERRKTISFTVPIFVAGAKTLVRTDSGVKALLDLRGKNFAVTAGSSGEKIAKKANDSGYELKLVPAKDNAEAFALLASKKAEGWLTDDILLASFRAQAPDPKQYTLLERRHTIEPLAIAYQKDDPAFETIVDREMLKIIARGDAQRLYERWFTRPIPPKNINLEQPMSNLLREFFRNPSKPSADVDVVLF